MGLRKTIIIFDAGNVFRTDCNLLEHVLTFYRRSEKVLHFHYNRVKLNIIATGSTVACPARTVKGKYSFAKITF